MKKYLKFSLLSLFAVMLTTNQVYADTTNQQIHNICVFDIYSYVYDFPAKYEITISDYTGKQVNKIEGETPKNRGFHTIGSYTIPKGSSIAVSVEFTINSKIYQSQSTYQVGNLDKRTLYIGSERGAGMYVKMD